MGHFTLGKKRVCLDIIENKQNGNGTIIKNEQEYQPILINNFCCYLVSKGMFLVKIEQSKNIPWKATDEKS